MRRRRARLTVFVLALVLIVLPLGLQAAAAAYASERIFQHETGPAPTAGMTEVPAGTLDKLAGFETNLPIVVMDVGGETFHRPYVWDDEKGYQVAVVYDPYNEGTLQLFDKAAGANRLTDTPALETHMRARIRGFTSLGYDKKQYLIKMIGEDGAKNRQEVLGMGAEWEWVLNISFVDQSLLRNYLCYNLAHTIMGNAPDVRFCEVFFKNGPNYRYEGLYLLMETIKQGDDRIPLTEYDPSFTQSAYILRRDRYEEDAVVLNTYGTRQGLTAEYLSVKYPSENEITDDTVQFIVDDISAFERALFAEDADEFLKYRDFIDMDSFVDYFLFNEFFANYDANTHSVYMYKDLHGRLAMGPVWDFDQALDNDAVHKLKVDSTAMHDGVWFAQMLRDGEFVKLVVERYAELRAGPLAESALNGLIEEIAAFIEPARQRDWSRWNYEAYHDRQAEENLSAQLAHGGNYDEVVRQLKSTLQVHGAWMDENLDSLYQFSTIQPGQHRKIEAEPVLNLIFGDDQLKWVAGTLVILLMIVFFSSVALIQRESI